jgi:Icc-related predicted phosphoesterase
MKIIALTDLHGNTAALPGLRPILANADLVLMAGDNTHFGHKSEMQEVIRAVRQINHAVLAVSGNCDYPDGEQCLTGEGISLNGRCIAYADVFIAGVSGSLPCPGSTPHEYGEEEFELNLEWLGKDIKHPFILVAHQPPYGTVNDCVSQGQHVGSKAIRAFIVKFSPLICFTGHIHEGRGMDSILQTPIINPGPARDGNYASLILEKGEIRDLRIDRIKI